jgi:hypothetical protein
MNFFMLKNEWKVLLLLSDSDLDIRVLFKNEFLEIFRAFLLGSKIKEVFEFEKSVHANQ